MSEEQQIKEMAEFLHPDRCFDGDISDCRKMESCDRCKATRLYEAGYCKRSELTPCDLCEFNPPSSGDGKPCFMCPARAKN